MFTFPKDIFIKREHINEKCRIAGESSYGERKGIFLNYLGAGFYDPTKKMQ